MQSEQYRLIISRIVRVLVKEHFPELRRNGNELKLFSAQVARTVHARMYGANVDGVDSPIWNSGKKPPLVEASELLKE